MEPIRITPYTLILVGAVLGFLLGLIPLILGIVKKKTKLGVAALIASIVGGAISGIYLIVPVLAVFTYLIFKKDNPNDNPVDVRVVNENPIDVKIDQSENR